MKTGRQQRTTYIYSFILTLIIIVALVLVNFNLLVYNDESNNPSSNVAEVPTPTSATSYSTRSSRQNEDFWKDRGDLNNTGFVDSKAPNYYNELWARSVVSPIDSSVTAAGELVYFGGTDRNIYAMNKYTGTTIWSQTTNNLGGSMSGDEIVSSAAVADGILFIGCKDKNIFALDADDGSFLWNFTTGGEVQGSPTVAGDKVIFGSYDGILYALDTVTGNEAWKFPTGYKIHSTPAVVNDIVYFGTESLQGMNDPCVYALDLQNGNELWNFTTLSGKGVHSSIAVANNTVYFGSIDRKVYALEMATGTERWNFTTGDVVYSSPAIDADNGIIYIGSNDERIYALPMKDPNSDGKIDSGEMYWSYQASDQLGYSSPVIADGKLFIASFDGHYYALNATTDLITTYERLIWGGWVGENYGISSSITISDGIIFMTNHKGIILAVATTDLLIFNKEIRISDQHPFEGEYIEIESTVYNNGSINLTGELLFKDWALDEPGVPQYVIETYWFDIDVGEFLKFDTTWQAVAGKHTLNAWLNSSQPHDSYIPNRLGAWQFENIFSLYSEGWAMFQNDTAHTGQSWLAPRTNKTEWLYQTGAAIKSTPAVAKGRVFVTSTDGKIYALKEHDRSDIWNYSVGSQIHSSPAFIASGGGADTIYDKIFFGADDGNVYCLDLNDGSLVWSYATGDKVRASPMVIDGIVYIGSTDGKLYALDEDGNSDGNQGVNDTSTTNSDLIWSSSIGSITQGSPAAVAEDNKLYIGTDDGKLFALDRLTGSTIWEQDYGASAAIKGSPTIGKDLVYFGAADYKVYAVEASNGNTKWSETTSGIIDSSPAINIVDEILFIGSNDGKFYAYNSLTGSLIWSYQVGSAIKSSPVVADNRVFFATENGIVYSIEAEGNGDQTTDLIWSFDAGDDIYSSPTVSNNGLYIGTDSGMLFRLGSPNVPPVARISEPLNESIYFTDEIITFNASESTDLEDTILRYNWSTDRVIQLTGELPKTVTTYVYDGFNPVVSTALPKGDHLVKLRVTDPMGGITNASTNITVFQPQTEYFLNSTIPADCTIYYGGKGTVEITQIPNPGSITTGSVGLFTKYRFESFVPRSKIGWSNISVSLKNAQGPEGLNLSRLRMYSWDVSNQNWIKIENSGLITLTDDEQRIWAQGDEVVTDQIKVYSPGTYDNAPPDLETVDSGVYPIEGSDFDTFTFKVEFTDIDNDGPVPAEGGSIMVYINGNPYVMTESTNDTDYTIGKEYQVQLTGAEIGIGTNNTFYFYAHDGTYQAIGDTSEISGPIVHLGTPVADAGPDITVETDEVFRLDGSNSYDEDGSIVTFEWDFNDQVDEDGDGIYDNDAERTGNNPTWKYSEPGEYIVTLIVTDDQGATAKDTILVNVTEKEEDDDGLGSSDVVVYSLIVVIIIIIILVVILLMVRKKVQEEKEYKKYKDRKKKKVEEEEEEEEEFECPSCGAAIGADDDECPECGEEFEEE